MDEREREATQDLKLKETELANCRETLRIQSEDLDARSSELLTFKKRSTKTYRNLKEQRDSALRDRSTALDEKEILAQLNTELLKTHKGVGEEVALKKDLRNTERVRDAARERMRALSNERRVLGQNLQEAEAARIEAEGRVLNTA